MRFIIHASDLSLQQCSVCYTPLFIVAQECAKGLFKPHLCKHLLGECYERNCLLFFTWFVSSKSVFTSESFINFNFTSYLLLGTFSLVYPLLNASNFNLESLSVRAVAVNLLNLVALCLRFNLAPMGPEGGGSMSRLQGWIYSLEALCLRLIFLAMALCHGTILGF